VYGVKNLTIYKNPKKPKNTKEKLQNEIAAAIFVDFSFVGFSDLDKWSRFYH